MQIFQLVTMLAAAAAVVLAEGPHVETPSSTPIAGKPLQVKWDGGEGPFTMVVNTFEVRCPSIFFLLLTTCTDR